MTVQEVKEATVTIAQLLRNAGAKITTKKKEGDNPQKSELVLLEDSYFKEAGSLFDTEFANKSH